MKIVAITETGTEFIYISRSVHGVPAAGAEKICSVLNSVKYKLKNETEKWQVYDIDRYDTAKIFSETQTFRIRKGIVSARYSSVPFVR